MDSHITIFVRNFGLQVCGSAAEGSKHEKVCVPNVILRVLSSPLSIAVVSLERLKKASLMKVTFAFGRNSKTPKNLKSSS